MKKSELKKIALKDILNAVQEDLRGKDLTTSLLNNKRKEIVKASVFSNDEAILCGQIWFTLVFEHVQKKYNEKLNIKWHKKEGDVIKKGQKICEIISSREIILISERTALNFLQMLSGISTKTRRYVKKLNDRKIKILDTRKTIPNLRHCQKYAVKIGGGFNHREGLYDEVLFKENHIASFHSFQNFIENIEKKIDLKKISIEVENLRDLRILCKYNPKNVLLDNFKLPQIKKAIKLVNRKKTTIEVSGNISLRNIHSFKDLKIDYISIGDLTKNIESVDFSMLIEN